MSNISKKRSIIERSNGKNNNKELKWMCCFSSLLLTPLKLYHSVLISLNFQRKEIELLVFFPLNFYCCLLYYFSLIKLLIYSFFVNFMSKFTLFADSFHYLYIYTDITDIYRDNRYISSYTSL